MDARLVLVTGGARSGKTSFAERRALDLGGDSVTYLATAEARDAEMADRIAAHRAARPGAWRTVEAPTDPARAIRAATTAVVVLDCLTLLASNLAVTEHPDGPVIDEAGEARFTAAIDELLAARDARRCHLVVVTNEVGSGIVPVDPLARRYRDLVGRANQIVAAAADEAYLLVSGRPLPLPPAPKREGP